MRQVHREILDFPSPPPVHAPAVTYGEDSKPLLHPRFVTTPGRGECRFILQMAELPLVPTRGESKVTSKFDLICCQLIVSWPSFCVIAEGARTIPITPTSCHTNFH